MRGGERGGDGERGRERVERWKEKEEIVRVQRGRGREGTEGEIGREWERQGKDWGRGRERDDRGRGTEGRKRERAKVREIERDSLWKSGL